MASASLCVHFCFCFFQSELRDKEIFFYPSSPEIKTTLCFPGAHGHE